MFLLVISAQYPPLIRMNLQKECVRSASPASLRVLIMTVGKDCGILSAEKRESGRNFGVQEKRDIAQTIKKRKVRVAITGSVKEWVACL
jgi:hypothetical protein